jgi:septal ring-binding cell division protein DamX
MNIKNITIALCALSLTACSNFYHSTTQNVPKSQKNRDAAIQLYPDGYDNGGAYAPDPNSISSQKPLIPEGALDTNAPVSFKQHDRGWVGKQNPQGYTIEISNSDKPADVASSLQKAPKNEPSAQVKYHHDGKQYYKGVYGSYPTYEAAQQALNALPEDVKQKATVKTWGNIQSVSE